MNDFEQSVMKKVLGLLGDGPAIGAPGATVTDEHLKRWDKLIGPLLEDDVRAVGDKIIDIVPEAKREAQVHGRDMFDAMIYRAIEGVARLKCRELILRARKYKKRF